MPKDIVTETCPAPECNLSEQDVEQFMDEMRSYTELFAPAFQRTEQWEWSQAYVSGLLGDAARKNVERMALELGEKVRTVPGTVQYFIGQSPWKADPVLAIHQRLVAETLGEADGIALIDESGVVKQGDDSAGVAAQYCGSVGKIANSQVGVYLGYASRKAITFETRSALLGGVSGLGRTESQVNRGTKMAGCSEYCLLSVIPTTRRS